VREAENRRNQREILAITNNSLIEAKRRAEAYFDFLANDIADILSPVMAYSDLVMPKLDRPEEIVKFDSRIRDQARRASSLISNLRRLESIDKIHPSEMDSMDLRTLFSALEEAIRTYFPKKEIKISYEIPDVKSIIVKGGEWVENVFTFIYDNAVRYSAGSAVELEIRVSPLKQENIETGWQIEISDHGPGIANNEKSHFEENFNIKVRELKGIATSLPFCISIIQSLGGELIIQDRIPGDHKQGTRVIIRLLKGE
jgi:two-component system C4-dicarboxylate transport sensor histidine kinase DctB